MPIEEDNSEVQFQKQLQDWLSSAKGFDYCNNVDIHIDDNSDLDDVIALADEHGFRGIVVPLCKIEELSTKLKEIVREKEIIPICLIDQPLGESSIDVRNYSIIAAKEKGAKEIEITAPYSLILNDDFKTASNDISTLYLTAKRNDLSIKYVIDQYHKSMTDVARTKICRIIASLKLPIVSISSGFYNGDINHSDHIIKLRSIKNKTKSAIKAFVNTTDPDCISLYPKAGADILGLHWSKAASLIHAYEAIVQKSGSENG